MKKLICLICAASLFILSGCSGGSIYANYREVEQLMVIQTMGFDKTAGGVTLSVSTGNSGGGTSSDDSGSSSSSGGSSKTSRMSVTADTVSLAQERLRDYSASEELFFAHTSYITLGEDTARDGISPYIIYIGRSTALREETPVFIIAGGTAKELVLGAGGKDYDATNVLKSLERNIEHRGDCEVFSASDITAALNQRGACLITAVKCAKAENVLEDAESDELTALPAGYAVIKGDKMVGTLDLNAARGVSILQNKLRSCYTELEVDETPVALLLENCTCEIKPVFSGDKLRSLDIKAELSAAMAEANSEPPLDDISSALETEAAAWITSALAAEKCYGCDFIGIGGILEKKNPFKLAGLSESFAKHLNGLSYNINVKAEIVRSFDIENTEGSE